MSSGMDQAARALPENTYLTSGDPGQSSGGTVNDVSTRQQMTAYENIFGPAARDIQFDSQRNKRHQRWHLPDALRGPNIFLTDRIDGLITDATNSPFTKNILPYKYVDQPDQKIKWNVYNFDEAVASRVPYEAAARVLPQSKSSFSGYAVRQGLAITMEHNFMMSPAGMDNFRKQLQQLVGSIQMTNDLDVHMALLLAPSYQKQQDEKYHDNNKTTAQSCRMYTDLFGFISKNENALDILIEDAKNTLQTWGSKPPTFMLCNRGLTKGLTMNPEKTMYLTNGPDGAQRLAAGPDLPSYRGLSFINTRKFSLESGTAPRDVLRRRVRVSEHYRIPWDSRNMGKRYEFYDQSRDSMFYLSWYQLYQASLPPINIAENLGKFLKNMHNTVTADQDFYDGSNLLTIYENLAGNNGAGIDFGQFKNMGAWLGFWKYTSPEKSECPKFLKKTFEVLQYQDGSFVLGHKLVVPENIPSELMDEYMTIATKMIMAVLNMNKQSLMTSDLWKSDKLKDLYTEIKPNADTPSSKPITDEDVVFPCDLFILRPNIEHYMMGIIFGRGGSPEELGATYWGQTELSVYDDTQHGIWGMSYKYHERAIVTNERNLIRVFDIAFDGYCGGNDSRIMKWNEEDTNEFAEATKDTTRPFSGPSMLVFSLPTYQNSFDSFPNPVVFHPVTTAQDSANSIPEHSYKFQDFHKHCCFSAKNPQCPWATEAISAVYELQYNQLNLSEWKSFSSMAGSAGSLATTDETGVCIFSFSGHMACIDTVRGGPVEITNGSGHLGPSYVGVASIREGRGLLQTQRQAVLQKLTV